MAKRLLLLCCILIPTMLLAKPVNFRFRHLSVENGLASNSVRAITQDHSGFLWIGTDEGLNRYDGTTIKTYTISPEGPGKFISALHATDKELWIGTDEGIYIYTFETSRFKHFDQTTSPNIRIKGIINHITEDKEGNIWIATNQQGVFKYIPSKHDMEQYAFSDVSGQIYNILADNENQIWAVSNQGKWGIYKLNKAENKFEPFPLHYSDSHKHDSQALAILEDSEHNLWLGTWECGLHKIDKYSGQTTTYLHPDDTKGITHIHSLMEYAPHQLLIGSDDGLLWFNTITEDYQLFTENETSPYPLSNRFVYPIIKDREGGIWIGTYYGGVNYISPKTDQFECFAHSQYTNSVNGRVIGRFCEDKNGHIWIASDDGGLDCYSPQSQKFTHYNANEGENSLSYHNVHALCLDGDQLWIGTYTGGVNVLNLKTGAFKKYFPSQETPNGLDGSSSYAIFKDRSEQIWVASMSSIHLYNKEKDNFTCIKTLNALTIDIDQDNKGNFHRHRPG